MHLAAITVRLIKTVVTARAETQAWVDKIEKLGGVSLNIATALTRRQESSLPPIPADINQRIDESLQDCERCLKVMKTKLKPIRGLPQQSLHNRIPESVGYLFTKPKIEIQEKLISDQHSAISLLLQFLSTEDQVATYEISQATNRTAEATLEAVESMDERLRSIERLLRTGTLSAEPSSEASHAHNSSPRSAIEGVSVDSSDIDEDDMLTPKELEKKYLPSTSEQPEDLLQPAEGLLMSAVKKREEAEVVTLLARSNRRKSLFAVDLDEWTVLHHAARWKSPIMLKNLLDTDLRDEHDLLNRKSRQGHTALMAAARHAGSPEATEMAKLLLNSGCDVNVVNTSGQTALSCATEDPPNGHSEELVRLLLDRGADVMLVAEDMDKRARKRWPDIADRID